MAILTKEEAQSILKKVIGFSTADECIATLGGSEEGNIRYAGNAVSTAGAASTMSLGVSAVYGKKVGTATVNEFDDESLKKVVQRAEELAKLAPENPEYMPVLEPQTYDESPTFVEATASIDPMKRADMVGKSIAISKQQGLESAGFLNNNTGFRAMMNSKGLYAYNKSTNVSFSITIRNQEGTGSGYVSNSFNDVNKLDTGALSSVAAFKAKNSAGARAIEPGKYTVILEPLAASDLVSWILRGFDARSADEGRSFMSKKGGGTRLGEQLFDERITIYSDPTNPDLPSATWDGDGLPLKKTTWVEKGIVKNLAYSRYWAAQKGVQPLSSGGGGRGFGGGGGMVIQGGNSSLEDMIKSTERGILVTRFWYIRSVDPQSLLLTGLTRDGTFYIENGEIKFPIKNFRFNESPIIMLNNVEDLGKSERSGSIMIPPMKIRDFTFTSLSDAI
ncbi:TldD/PmbA family protein [Olivibacter sitiensis]|uniref:TldD/PmbA family protein n=1 Tax=Olivibacter sitiensis TaxID=376470 RepID=UPI0004047C7D|nr:TldD/PmbA family protein [Olivibacter sitiensis]